MEVSEGWITIIEIIMLILLLILFLIISWYVYLKLKFSSDSLTETQSEAASEQETSRHPDGTRLPSYEEVTRIRPGLRHRDSRDNNLTTDDVRNSSIDTVQSNIEQAGGSKNQSGEYSNNPNYDNSANEDRSGVRYISESESICMYGVCGNIETVVKNNDDIINDAGGESNLEKSKCETSDCQESIKDIGNDEGGSEVQDYGKDINVIENLTECNIESENGDKTEDSCKNLDNIDNDKYGKECDGGGATNSGDDRHDKCDADVISIGNSEAESIDQYCSADGISFSSKYDTASGGSGVTME